MGKELETELQKHSERPCNFQGLSDCEVLVHLYQESGPEFLSKWQVRGMFAFVLYDEERDSYIVARDAIGIIPLYMGHGRDGSVWIASEMKALVDHCETFECFPPGHVYDSKTGKTTPWHTTSWWDAQRLPTKVITEDDLRLALEESVKSHLMADVPYGVLLSGGLDSSLVASIMNKF